MSATRVLPDANVLFPRTLRDWLLLLRNYTSGEMFQLYYTEDIIAEAIARIRDRKPELDGGAITWIADELRKAMTRLDNFTIDQESYPGPDEGDLHVHSAAHCNKINKLVTLDKGFLDLSEDQKDELHYDIFTPDDFFTLIQDSSPETVRLVTQDQFQHWSRKCGVRPDLPQRLRDSKCPQFATAVEQHVIDLKL